ncbi:GIY-YIG nuclease family protein [Ferruginibacter albus]|uniref:GIY-YIG nuclease family protein n=1 Tax=Ferruginibacter albus TaxID=2875540 RepID=UPI001CC5CA16|nr:GIY-YIG nuclease family protein [Ferruginibacter albus]UAY50751.1 GIY-YIG nuclease family protein [Ferruginibacter albus]
MKTKKELKEDYKQIRFKIGVFQIRNTVNGKIFISSAVNLDAIRNSNFAQLRFGAHRNEELQKDWNQYGEENFQFEILDEIKQDETKVVDYSKDVKQLEKMYIDELKPFDDKGYNMEPKS